MKYLLYSILLLIVGQLSAQDTADHPKPLFLSVATGRVETGKSYYYKPVATDSSDRDFIIGANTLPQGLYFNADKSISGSIAKPGQYPVQLFATNGRDTTKQFFMLTAYNEHTDNILCLGNSITNGTNKYNSYRRYLWKLLHAGAYNFDFTGSWDKHHMGGAVPDPDFDMDHEGHSGWTAADIFQPPSWDSVRGNIYSWMQLYTPDIVLVELGTNDVFQCRNVRDIIGDFTRLVQLLRDRNKNVKFFFAKIPPLGKQWASEKLCGNDTTYNARILLLNEAIGLFAQKNSTKSSPVMAVDQFSDVDTDKDMYDDIHPNASGERKMAERWYTAIKKYLHKLD
ncbi:MAG: putative Ig domain-containing protein [Chitinophagaceae bacterium]|nr:putative Ig domain-containing protein [Chitinophagaceae bacterium]